MSSAKKGIANREAEKGKERKEGGTLTRAGTTPNVSHRSTTSSTSERPPFNLYHSSSKSHRSTTQSAAARPAMRPPVYSKSSTPSQTAVKPKPPIKPRWGQSTAETTAEKQNSTLKSRLGANRLANRSNEPSSPAKPGLRPSTANSLGARPLTGNLAGKPGFPRSQSNATSGRKAAPLVAGRPRPSQPDKSSPAIRGRQSAVGATKPSALPRSATSPLCLATVQSPSTTSVTSSPSSTVPSYERDELLPVVDEADDSDDLTCLLVRSVSQYSLSSARSSFSCRRGSSSSGSSSFGSAVTCISSCEPCTTTTTTADDGDRRDLGNESSATATISLATIPLEMSSSMIAEAAEAQVPPITDQRDADETDTSGPLDMSSMNAETAGPPDVSPSSGEAITRDRTPSRNNSKAKERPRKRSVSPVSSPDDIREVCWSEEEPAEAMKSPSKRSISSDIRAVSRSEEEPAEAMKSPSKRSISSDIRAVSRSEEGPAEAMKSPSKRSISSDIRAVSRSEEEPAEAMKSPSKRSISSDIRAVSRSEEGPAEAMKSPSKRSIFIESLPDISEVSRSGKSPFEVKKSPSKRSVSPESFPDDTRQISKHGERPAGAKKCPTRRCILSESSPDHVRKASESQKHSCKPGENTSVPNKTTFQAKKTPLSKRIVPVVSSSETGKNTLQRSRSEDRKHRAEKTSPHVSKTRLKGRSLTGIKTKVPAANDPSEQVNKINNLSAQKAAAKSSTSKNLLERTCSKGGSKDNQGRETKDSPKESVDIDDVIVTRGAFVGQDVFEEEGSPPCNEDREVEDEDEDDPWIPMFIDPRQACPNVFNMQTDWVAPGVRGFDVLDMDGMYLNVNPSSAYDESKTGLIIEEITDSMEPECVSSGRPDCRDTNKNPFAPIERNNICHEVHLSELEQRLEEISREMAMMEDVDSEVENSESCPTKQQRLTTRQRPTTEHSPTTQQRPTMQHSPTTKHRPGTQHRHCGKCTPTTQCRPKTRRGPVSQLRSKPASAELTKLPTIFESVSSVCTDFLEKCTATLNAIVETSDSLVEKLQTTLSYHLSMLSEPAWSNYTLGSAEFKSLLVSWKQDCSITSDERRGNREAVETCVIRLFEDIRALVEHNQHLWQSESESVQKLREMVGTHAQYMDATDKYSRMVDNMNIELQEATTALAREREEKVKAQELQLKSQEIATHQTRQCNRLQATFFERNSELMKFIKEDKNLKRKFLAKELEHVVKIKELEKSTRASTKVITKLEAGRQSLRVKLAELKDHQEKSTRDTTETILGLQKKVKHYAAIHLDTKSRIAELTAKLNGKQVEEKAACNELKARLEKTLEELAEEKKNSQRLKADLKEKEKLLSSMEKVSLQLCQHTDPTLTFPNTRPDLTCKTNEIDLWTELQATKVILKETQLKCVSIEGERDKALEVMKGIGGHTALKDEEIASLEQENRYLREELSVNSTHLKKEHEKIQRMQKLLDSMTESREADPELLEIHKLKEKLLLMETIMRKSSSREETLEALLAERDQDVDKKDMVIHEQANALRARDKLLDVMRSRLHYPPQAYPTASSDTETLASTSDQLSTMSQDTHHDRKEREHRRNQIMMAAEDRSGFDQRISDLEDRLRGAERDLRTEV